MQMKFTYDGDGKRVKSEAYTNGVITETILFIGGHYEIKNPGSGQTVAKYYFAGASRIAMRKYTIPQSTTLTYLLGDHLGSTSLAVDASTGEAIETRYKPWGEVRYTTPNKTLPTQYTFTGQFSYVNDDATDLGSAGFGLLFYNARMYDPALGRFISADTIVPGGVQGLDRYAYVNNSPIMYIDPSGHITLCGASCEDAFEQPQYSLDDMAEMYGVTFSSSNGEWSVVNKAIVLLGVYKAAQAIQKDINSSRDAAYQSCIDNMAGPTSTCSPINSVTTSQAFRGAFNTGVNFEWVDRACSIGESTCYADAYQFPNTIRVYSKFWATDGTNNFQLSTPITPELIVHELGHAFNSRAGGGPVSYVTVYDGGSLLVRPDGFVGGYSFGQDKTGSEIFADMFVGWVYGQWDYGVDLGSIRNTVMTTNMSGWIIDARFHR